MAGDALSESKLSESAQKVVDRAIDEARRRGQILTNGHVFLAFARTEADAFAAWMREVGVDPRNIELAVEQHLENTTPNPLAELRISPATRLLFKLAQHHAVRCGRSWFGSIDLFAAIFEESQDPVTAIVRQHGAEPEAVITRGRAAMREFELREEQLEQERRAAPIADWKRSRPEGALVEEAEEVEPRSVKRRFLDLIGLRRTRT